jgi:hypothetical protein
MRSRNVALVILKVEVHVERVQLRVHSSARWGNLGELGVKISKCGSGPITSWSPTSSNLKNSARSSPSPNTINIWRLDQLATVFSLCTLAYLFSAYRIN